ncbi:MAG TPA: universal stress protein [Solirubrobacteraceae bacterium]|nr:universal stress protein [Solirubrobacteraceae bacterium]
MQHASSVTLFCYDGSNSSKHAIAATSEALSTNNVVLLHIWDPPIEALADSYSDPGTPVGKSLDQLEADEIARATALAQEGVELARAVGWDAHMRLERAAGAEWRVILDVASSLDAGLIVLGTRGRTAVEDGLLGASVSRDVLRHSSRPVLLVPAPVETYSPSDGEHSIPATAAY